MKLLPLAAMMALSMPTGGAVALSRGSSEGTPMLYSNAYRSRPGKGKGRRPYHGSHRFVAMDKREARKARRRR